MDETFIILLKSWLIICQGGPYKTCLLVVGEVYQVSLAAVLGEVYLMFYNYRASKSVFIFVTITWVIVKTFYELAIFRNRYFWSWLEWGLQFSSKAIASCLASYCRSYCLCCIKQPVYVLCLSWFLWSKMVS